MLLGEASLEARNPQHAERWISLLELYDGTGEIVRPERRNA